MTEDIKDLLSAAKEGDNFSDRRFDVFLKENGFTETDTEQRLLLSDLFLFYSCWHYVRYKNIPHKYNYYENSPMFLAYKIRKRRGPQFAWGFMCSSQFMQAFERFKPRSQEWQKKLDQHLGAKKAHVRRKVNRRENKQLETALNSLRLAKK